MKPTYHLYGMKITLDGDLEEAARRAHLAQKLMFQTKMLNVNNLDIIQNNLRLSDGTHVYVLSQHGLDSAIIYVPPKQPVKKPGKRRWIEQFIWPAFEVFEDQSCDIFLGVVLCKGGGFNPPYTFVPKDSLPCDLPNVEPEELKKERIWSVNSLEKQTIYEDISPNGRTSGSFVYKDFTPPLFEHNRKFLEYVARGCQTYEDTYNNNTYCKNRGYPETVTRKKYACEGNDKFYLTTWEDWGGHYALSFEFSDDPDTDPESWDFYYYFPGDMVRSSGRNYPGDKPLRQLNFGDNEEVDFQYTYVGAGYLIDSDAASSIYDYNIWNVTKDYFYPFNYCYYYKSAGYNLDDAIQVILDALAARGPYYPDGYDSGTYYRIAGGNSSINDYTLEVTRFYPNLKYYTQAIYDENQFSIIASTKVDMQTQHWYCLDFVIPDMCYAMPPCPAPSVDAHQDLERENGYKNIVAYLDQEQHIVKEYFSSSDAGKAYYTKYFLGVDNTKHAMYWAQTDTELYFTYAKKSEGEETEFFTTELPSGGLLPDIDIPLYVANGYWNKYSVFRLIRETVTYEEDL